MASREDQEYSSQAPAPYIGQFLQGDIFPFAQQFLRQQFQNYGQADSSPYTYTGQRVADFDPREQYGMELADQAIGSYRPYLGRQAGLLDEASQSIRQGQGTGSRTTDEALAQTRGATPDFTGARTGIASSVSELGGAVPDYSGARSGLSRAELSGYGSTAGFNPQGIGSFYNPFEDQVVEQTLRDVREGLAKGDMGLRDEAVSAGAFGGSRSRMRRDELAENVARGAAEQVGAIRSGGYQDAANRAQQAFEAQQQRQAGLAGLQSQIAGQRGGFAGQEAQAALGRAGQLGELAGREGTFASQEAQAALGRGSQLGQLGQQQFGMGLQGGQGLSSFGNQYGQMAQVLPQLQQTDISSMMGMGGLGRGRQQSLMDLNYQNFTGQYNLPMQTLQNVGALTASLGPMAGGYGYAGGAPTYNTNYTPSGAMGTGLMGTTVASNNFNPNMISGGYNPNTNYNTGIGGLTGGGGGGFGNNYRLL